MRGSIKQRSEGAWSLILNLGRDPTTGRYKQKWITFKGTKKQAQAELARLINEMNQGTYVEPSKLTVAAYLERWLEDTVRHKVANKTFERYAEIARNHLVPALGKHLLSKLQPLHIQTCYSQALKSGRRDGTGGLSAQTVLHHHRLLHKALKDAVQLQLLVRNPADAVPPPRATRKEMLALNEAQTVELLRLVDGTHLYIPVLLAVMTGMRRGEVLALRWQDVDLEKGRAYVRQALEDTRAGINFKAPKTNKSRRAVALPAMVSEALRRHKITQAKDKLLLGPIYQDQGLVCARPDGRFLDPSEHVTRAFAHLIRASGLPPIRFHDLRHTHATLLLRQGVPAKVVSERLGHSNIGITLDTYSHVLPGMQEEAAAKVEAAILGVDPASRAVGETSGNSARIRTFKTEKKAPR